MAMYLSEKYRVERDHGGISVTFRPSGGTIFFQPGDDASAFEDDLEAFIRAEEQGIAVPEAVFFGQYMEGE